MEKRKKYIQFIGALLLCIVFSGCGNSQKQTYEEAIAAYDSADYVTALALFDELGEYKDAKNYVELCNYKIADEEVNKNSSENIVQGNTTLPTAHPSEDEEELTSFELAKRALNEEKYEEAVVYLEQATEGYSDKSEYLIQIANQFIKEKKTIEAQNVIDSIRKYNEADADELQLSLKYALYEDDPFQKADGEYTWAYSFSNPDLIEGMLSLFYGTWYDYNNDCTIEITKNTLNGRPYCVYALYDTYDCTELFYKYIDEPDKMYGIEYSTMMFNSQYEVIYSILDCSWYAEGIEYSDINAYSVDEFTYDQLMAAEEAYYNTPLVKSAPVAYDSNINTEISYNGDNSRIVGDGEYFDEIVSGAWYDEYGNPIADYLPLDFLYDFYSFDYDPRIKNMRYVDGATFTIDELKRSSSTTTSGLQYVIYVALVYDIQKSVDINGTPYMVGYEYFSDEPIIITGNFKNVLNGDNFMVIGRFDGLTIEDIPVICGVKGSIANGRY